MFFSDNQIQIQADSNFPAFSGAHIKDSYSLWLVGVPTFAGCVLIYDKAVLLVLEDRGHLEKAVRFLIRLEYDRLDGYLCGGAEACGLESWYTGAMPMEQFGLLSVQDLKARLDNSDTLFVLDVRSDDKCDEGYIEGALHIYVGHIEKRMNEVLVDQPIALICSVENRGGLGASIVRRAGRREVYNVLGGMLAWEKADYPLI
jgi:hydroxyacylglutathione hydrolase